jgi:hypothetical protein
VNQYSQQSGNFQGQQSYLNQGQNFQPSGFVQSHYQGQLSQPTFGRTSQSIVSNSPGGYQQTHAFNQGHQSYIPSGYASTSQSAGMNNSYTSHQPVQSHASSPATAFGNVGPVIAHVGYQAGHEQNHSFYQPTAMHNTGMHFGGYSQPMAQGQHQGNYGPTPVQSYTHSATPVLDATNAYQQTGPVISQLGYTANNANQYR